MPRDSDPSDGVDRNVRTPEPTISRRTTLASVTTFGSAAFAGCLGGNGDGGNGNGNGNGNGGDELNVAIISSNAGFDDRAFNDMALKGLKEAKSEHGFTLNEIEETDIAKFGDVQATAAQNNDFVVLVGFQHTEPLQKNAPEFPDTKFMLINDNIEADNVAGYVWANHEMSFLAGVQAGTVTDFDLTHKGSETDPEGNHVGFVGGEEVPLIEAFEQAYIGGAEWANSDVEVTVGYAGSFGDPSAGEQVAASQYDDGADIIYHAAAATGPGIFDAAQAANRFAIGVDADQSVTLPEYSDVIIGSAVKFINLGTEEAATAVATDSWQDVAGFNVLGLEQDAVDLVTGQEFSEKLPDELETNLSEAKDGIVGGDIEVPCSHDGC